MNHIKSIVLEQLVQIAHVRERPPVSFVESYRLIM